MRHACSLKGIVNIPLRSLLLVHYTTVTRDIDAPIGGAWYPDAKSVLLKGFGLGIRQLDYLDITAFATIVLDSLGPNKTRFRWIAEGLPLLDKYMAVLREDLNERFDGLIVAIANQLVKDD
ncbi:hypothetical protein BDV41DRAFT_566065 [Aspergillus transmontanensis]|uniref:Uncharacterized protein n=1 Tax=Aspergillus transmontanensis TaxID=1034304 RepID=A0A5N6VR11_9EURO|nr:hypothetical protein BDV41DRAFT_566065 [Aspergillus transmontanensis]